MKQFLKHLYKYIHPFLNWRFLVCFMIPWMITNGIWYIGFYLGTKYHLVWLASFCGAYIANLYMPWACEKLLIIPVALWLCKILFKNHEPTVKALNEMLETAKADFMKFVYVFGKTKRRNRILRKRYELAKEKYESRA